MERYKSIVKSVVISGARHAFLMSDGQTWLSVFLRRDQKPEFQQAVRQVTQGQEYIFDCIRNERNFLNIVAIQHPSWPQAIPAKDVQPGAPAQPQSQAVTAPPMPGPGTPPPPPIPGSAVPSPAAQPVIQPLTVQTPAPAPAAVIPLPPAPPQAESPATVTLGPSAPPSATPSGITEIGEPSEISLREQLIARENASTTAASLLCAVIEKGQLPEDVESFITWIGVKFVQLQDIISSNTLKIQGEEEIPF